VIVMWFGDQYIDYVKKFIDMTYEQQKMLLSKPNLSKNQIDNIKTGTIAYCTGYVVALRNFNILSDSAEKLLSDYIIKKGA